MSDHTGDNTQETNEGESSVIRELRAQRDAAVQKAKELEAQAEEGAKARKAEAERLLVDAGYPGFDTEVVLGRVEGFPTLESVSEALTGLGLAPKASDDGEPAPAPEAPPAPQGKQVADVANLGQRVANASGNKAAGVAEKLAAAKSTAEIDAIMAEAGLLHTV